MAWTLKGLIDGGNSELGLPDLTRKVVDGIVKLKRHADRGMEVLPREVEIHIIVGEGSVDVIRRFIEDPTFDKEVESALMNRIVKAREDALPVRRYFVEPGKKTKVEVRETPPKSFRIVIKGGDRDGQNMALPRDRKDLLLGRGPWHGDDQQIANDVVVCDGERSVSRRAARLHRVGATFELQSLDQREAVAVVRADGHRLRPALSASGRVPVRAGEAIEFTDGTRAVVTLQLEEV